MDHKKSPKGKKRQSKQFEDTLWECSACTYRNNPEAFKCSMCGIRKGTSTRKPKLNPDMLEVQVQKHAFTPPAVSHHRMPRESEPSSSRSEGRPGSSASNDPGNSEDEEEVSPTATTTATTTSSNSTPTTTSATSLSKSKKLKLPPVPKGKSKVGGSLTNGSNCSSSSSVPTYSTPIIGRGGRIRNIDRKTGCNYDISVDDVTITITEYKLKAPRKEKKGGVGGAGDGGSGSASLSTNHSDGESDSQDTRTT